MTSYLIFADAQARTWANKRAKGFNTTSVELEFCLLMTEVGEAFDAWRKNAPRRPPVIRRILAWLRLWQLPAAPAPQPVRDEVADVLIFGLSVAQMLGFDAGEAVAGKMAVNEARAYRQLPGGTHAKTG